MNTLNHTTDSNTVISKHERINAHFYSAERSSRERSTSRYALDVSQKIKKEIWKKNSHNKSSSYEVGLSKKQRKIADINNPIVNKDQLVKQHHNFSKKHCQKNSLNKQYRKNMATSKAKVREHQKAKLDSEAEMKSQQYLKKTSKTASTLSSKNELTLKKKMYPRNSKDVNQQIYQRSSLIMSLYQSKCKNLEKENKHIKQKYFQVIKKLKNMHMMQNQV